MKGIFKTDRGKLRDHNEDNGAVFIKSEAVLALVADGMGGHKAGEEASLLAVQAIEKAWQGFDPDIKNEDENWLQETVHLANQAIYNYAEEHPDCKGMGTTLVVALCRPEAFTIANVGDSRGYLIKDQETIEQITEDHSLVNELVKAGQLSAEDAAHHPRKNVLMRALGTDRETEVDIYHQEWALGQILLLCSDGLSNLVETAEMLSISTSEQTVEEKAEALIHLANAAGGNDNISVTLVINDVFVNDGGEGI